MTTAASNLPDGTFFYDADVGWVGTTSDGHTFVIQVIDDTPPVQGQRRVDPSRDNMPERVRHALDEYQQIQDQSGSDMPEEAFQGSESTADRTARTAATLRARYRRLGPVDIIRVPSSRTTRTTRTTDTNDSIMFNRFQTYCALVRRAHANQALDPAANQTANVRAAEEGGLIISIGPSDITGDDGASLASVCATSASPSHTASDESRPRGSHVMDPTEEETAALLRELGLAGNQVLIDHF